MTAPELHPALAARLAEGLGAPPVSALPVAVARAGLLARYGSLPSAAVHSVSDRIVAQERGDLRMRIYRNDPDTLRPILLFFHGGGFVLGSIDTHDAVCRQICAGARVAVVAVDYALAPERRFPAGFDDCVAAIRWVAAHANEVGGDPRRIVLAGDSAGANLAVVSALRLIEEDGPNLAALLLAYPCTDAPNLERRSYVERGQGFGLTGEGMQWFFSQYLERIDQSTDPSVAPLRSERLAGLPPTWLLTAEFDPLRDEGIEFAVKLKAAGVDVTHRHQDDANHGFLSWAGTNEPSKQALEAACAWLTARLT